MPGTPDGLFSASIFIQHLERQTVGGKTRAGRRSRLPTPTPLSRIEHPDPPTPTHSPPPSPTPLAPIPPPMISAQDTAALLQLDRQRTADLERSQRDNLTSRQAVAQIQSHNEAVEWMYGQAELVKNTLRKENEELARQRDWLLKRCPEDQVSSLRTAGLTPYRPRVYALKPNHLEPEPPHREKEPAPGSHVYRPKSEMHPVEAPPMAHDYRPTPRPKPRAEGTGSSRPPVDIPPQPTLYTLPAKSLPADRIPKETIEERPHGG